MTKKDDKTESQENTSKKSVIADKPKKVKMIKVSEAEYQSMQIQVEEFKDKYLRLLAEFENARKRQERERLEFIKYANEGVMTDFLNIVDDLERAVMVAKDKHQDYDSFLKGVELVMNRVAELLEKHGVKEMDPVGKVFDPFAHEILMQEPTDQFDNGAVMELFQKGYKLGDRVIRTAKVKVAINNTEKSEGQEEKSEGQEKKGEDQKVKGEGEATKEEK